MWAFELLRDDLRRPDVDERPRRHRYQDGVRQLAGELRDCDTDAQPCSEKSTKKNKTTGEPHIRELARGAATHPSRFRRGVGANMA